MGTFLLFCPTMRVKRRKQDPKTDSQKSCFKILFEMIAVLSVEQRGLLPGGGEPHDQFVSEVATLKKEIKEIRKSVMEQIEAMDVEELKRVLDFLEKIKQQKEQEQEGD